MSTQTTAENKAAVQREFDEAWNGDDLSVLDDLYAEDVRIATVRTGSEGTLVSRDDLKDLYSEWDEAFPDATTELHAVVAEDDSVMVWWSIRGTHEGAFRGIDPTGNEIDVEGFSYRRFEDGRIAESKDAASMTTLFKQLGVPLPV
ncbi:ester cyclase [Haloferax sp. S1W]|uniref:ester cyclase n=1 Tax=Haloferax sp. S1W TaxID=3377110 RepID=UPI0037C7D6AB